LYCSPNYYGNDCEIFCAPNSYRYECDLNTGEKICKHGYFGPDCLSGRIEEKTTNNKINFVFIDVRACEAKPCLNNGTRVVYLRSYLCQCQTGFTGRSCEIGKYY